MRILVTNDDGIHAPGLKVCEDIARALSDDVWVVAPETDQSGVSHSLSLNDPLRLREVGERHFAVKGTPTDCVIMAVRHIMSEQRPDLVLSGVNRGQQRRRGRDLFRHRRGRDGRHACSAFRRSRCRRPMVRGNRDAPPWDTGARIRRPTSSARCSPPASRAACWSTSISPIAMPDAVQGVAVTAQGKRDQELLRIEPRFDGRGNPYYWIAFARKGKPTPATAPISPRSPTTAFR